MTEQQILDKTIEYLNKYSNCFKSWDYSLDINVRISCLIASGDERYSHRSYEMDILLGESRICSSFYDFISSEFRIAYNIIKDLAQHGTNN